MVIEDTEKNKTRNCFRKNVACARKQENIVVETFSVN